VRALGFLHQKGTNTANPGCCALPESGQRHRLAVNQGRQSARAAVCAYLETWAPGHRRIPRIAQEHRRRPAARTHDMTQPTGFPDLFQIEARNSRRQVDPVFPVRYADSARPAPRPSRAVTSNYEALIEYGKLKLHKTIQARDLVAQDARMLSKPGQPVGSPSRDACNLRSPQAARRVVHSSNSACTRNHPEQPRRMKSPCATWARSTCQPYRGTAAGEHGQARGHQSSPPCAMLDKSSTSLLQRAAAKELQTSHRPVGLGIMAFRMRLLQHIA